LGGRKKRKLGGKKSCRARSAAGGKKGGVEKKGTKGIWVGCFKGGFLKEKRNGSVRLETGVTEERRKSDAGGLREEGRLEGGKPSSEKRKIKFATSKKRHAIHGNIGEPKWGGWVKGVIFLFMCISYKGSGKRTSFGKQKGISRPQKGEKSRVEKQLARDEKSQNRKGIFSGEVRRGGIRREGKNGPREGEK